jgi:hypothetical protein
VVVEQGVYLNPTIDFGQKGEISARLWVKSTKAIRELPRTLIDSLNCGATKPIKQRFA